MLGFSAHVLNSGDKLSVVIPADLILLIVFSLPLLVLVGVYRQMNTPRGRRKCIIYMVINVVFLGFLFTPAKVVLDAKQGTATVSNVFFFIPHHRVMPLASVQGAMIKNSEVTEAVALVLTDGRAIQLTPFQQIGGTDTAVSAINDFLREHGGTGQPY